jgi:hypothetical protein
MDFRPALFRTAALILIAASPAAHAKDTPDAPGGTLSFVDTGGSCTSEGPWTTRALQQSDAIAKTIENLKDDPNCKALVNALSAVDLSDLAALKKSALAAGPGANFEQLPQQVNNLRNVLATNQDNARLTTALTPVLAKTTIDVATSAASLNGPISQGDIDSIKDRMWKVRGAGEGLLSALFTAGPQAQLCLGSKSHADAGLSLVGAAIQMMAAFASSDEAHGPGFPKLMSQFSFFLRDMKFQKLKNKLDLSRYYTELSCLVETTQKQYCDVRDGLKLLEFQAKEMEITAQLREAMERGTVNKNTAIEGYMLLNREVPAISTWLQKVQFGADAKTANDAAFKNDTITAVNTLLANINNLQGTYNENKTQVYDSLTTDKQKAQNIRALLTSLTAIMTQNRSKINFFTNAIAAEAIEFYLIGRDNPPDEVLGKVSGIPMDPDKYLLDDNRAPEFKNPDKLMAKILERLGSLSDLALREGSKYFANRMSVDHLNLVDEALTDSSINVYQALKNVRSYIQRMQAKYYTGDHDQDKGIALSMGDTLGRLDRVIANFDALFALAMEVQKPIELPAQPQPAPPIQASNDPNAPQALPVPPPPPPSPEELKKLLAQAQKERTDEVKAAFDNLIVSVYNEFNILLQKESFVNQRLTTYVKYDLFERVKHNEDMSPYVQYLLIASGRNVLNRLQEFQGGYNIAESETDLAEAQRINRDNLDVVEDLFAADVWSYVNRLSKDSGKEYVKRASDNPYIPFWQTLLPTNIAKAFWDNLTHLPGLTGQLPSQDDDDALKYLRAKMCTISLGFKNWGGFYEVCKGSVLQSRLTADAPADLPLRFSYDELVAEKTHGVGVMGRLRSIFEGVPPEGKRYEHVCALRDFFRNNQVYWMTLEFNQSVEATKTNPDTIKLQGYIP